MTNSQKTIAAANCNRRPNPKKKPKIVNQLHPV